MVENNPQEHKTSVKPSNEKSTIDIALDRAAKVFAILGGLAMIWVTLHFSCVASNLSQRGIEVSQVQRKYSIKPHLELLSSINYTQNYDEIVVPIKNYGAGQATKVRALVAYDGEL